MRNYKTCIAAAAFLLLFVAFLPGADPFDADLHLTITGLTDPAAPRRIGDFLLFSYRPDHPARLVGVSFEHEDYRIIHPYLRNEHGLFFLVLPVPRDTARILYRLVVDGLWIHDPENPDTVRDRTGIPLSRVALSGDRPEQPLQSPQLLTDGRVRFVYRGEAGGQVSIAGDFNNWDPFIHHLAEIRPGVYSITLRMPPGRHFYYFLHDGRRMPDQLNDFRLYDREGIPVSALVVPG